MTQEEMARTMQFIVEQQAKNTVGLDELKEAQVRVSSQIKAMSEKIEWLSWRISELTARIALLARPARVDTNTKGHDWREAMERLLISNEVARDFAHKISELTMNANKRVTQLENKISPDVSS